MRGEADRGDRAVVITLRYPVTFALDVADPLCRGVIAAKPPLLLLPAVAPPPSSTKRAFAESLIRC